MRIVIDLQGAQSESRYRGIGRFSLSLAQSIVRNRGEHEVLIALNGLFPETIEPIRAAFEGVLSQERIHVWYASGPVRESHHENDWRRNVAEHVREAFLASLKPNILLVSSLFEGYADDAVTSIGQFVPQIATVATLYDLIPLRYPKVYLEDNPRYARYYERKIEYLRRASQWFSISESAAAEGRSVLGLRAESVVNIGAACDAIFRRIEISETDMRSLFERHGISRPFIFYAGGADGRKNLNQLIRAFAGLPKPLREKHQLVLAGKMPVEKVTELRKEADSVGLSESQLLFPGFVTDKELVQLYNLCAVFAFPAWDEGFGLPALEAMACGSPVIASNISSVTEMIGRKNALFNPHDDRSLTAKLLKVLSDEGFRVDLVRHGLKRAQRFSWDKVAKNAIAAFERLHSVTSPDWNTDNLSDLIPRLVRSVSAIVPSNLPDQQMLKLANALGRIPTDNFPKQLLVDISELVQRDARTGVQRVTRSILKELLKAQPAGYAVAPVYATVHNKGYRYATRFDTALAGVRSDLGGAPIDYRPGDIFLGLDLQHHVVAAQKEYLASLRRDGVKVYFVVYDLLPILMPHAFPTGADARHQTWLETLLGYDGVACISRSVADELTKWRHVHGARGLRPFKIGWFHLGADVENSLPTRGLPEDAKQVLRAVTSRRTFLMVGTVEPRKCHAQVLLAFDQLWSEDLDVNLVIAGKQGWMVEPLAEQLAAHPEVGKRLFWLNGISDEYLEKVYQACTCLIAASQGEGFGLPLIEAARAGLPIIARDIPVFREVARERAFYFRGDSPHELAEALRIWQGLFRGGRHPEPDGIEWLTWKQSAQWLLDIILQDKWSLSVGPKANAIDRAPTMGELIVSNDQPGEKYAAPGDMPAKSPHMEDISTDSESG